jgi:hypothetical protein
VKKLYLALLATAVIAAPAAAADKLTVLQANQLSVALRSLDGHIIVIKQNGQDATVMIPWEFNSAAVRLRIANDLAIVDAAVKVSDDVRNTIFKEVTKKAGVTELRPGTPERDDYDRQAADLMAQPAAGTQDLARIKASELKLDRNEIPVSILSALKPIFDDDVTPK